MSDEHAVETRTATDEPATPPPPSPPPPRPAAPPPRRRGPGAFTLMVLPGLLTLSVVAGFLALTGGLPTDWAQDESPQQSAANGVDATYGPWLRKAAEACTVVTPSLLAAQIDQLSGWDNGSITATDAPATAAASAAGSATDEQGIAAFTDAEWRTWGKDDDGNGSSSPLDQADAIMALGRQDCSLAEKITDLRTDGTVSGELVDLTLAAYAVGTDVVAGAGKVPAEAQTYLTEVKALFARYEEFDRDDSAGGAPANAILAAPVTALTITSPFGSRQHPLTGVTKLHTGVDFGAPQGAQVSSAREGTVVFAAMTKAYGNRVVVDHGAIDGKPLQTTYSHLSAIEVAVGQTVQTGAPIGRVGSTGLSTGPHLHFEVIYDGYYADPQPWLASNG